MPNEKNNINESFLLSFYQMCHSLGVVRQLTEQEFMSDDMTLSPKGAKMCLQYSPIELSDEFVDTYRSKFSRDRIGKSGKMGDRVTIVKKLSRFKVQFPQFTDEIILQATEDYIKANKDPTFIMDADNFIFKIDRLKAEEKSRLAAFCEEVGVKNKPSLNTWE